MIFVLSFIYMWITCGITEAVSFGMQKQAWEYTPISLDANSSNENLLKIDMKVERIGRGDFALSGSIVVNTEFGVNDWIEAKVYRSSTGGNDYKMTPFRVKKQTINEFLGTTYKTYLMADIRDCSNAPQAEANELPVVEKKIYTLNKCKFSTDSMPSYMMPGYYKMSAIISGGLDAVLELISEITEKAS